jgi:alkylhydroperoxidase family enzyme
MAWIQTIPDANADGELHELFDQARDPAHGVVDNIMRVHSLSPAGLRGHFELYRAVMAGTPTLRKADRELIAVVVSKLNGCVY